MWNDRLNINYELLVRYQLLHYLEPDFRHLLQLKLHLNSDIWKGSIS